MKVLYIYFSVLLLVIALIIFLKQRARSENEEYLTIPATNATTLDIDDEKYVLFNPSIEIYDDNSLISICRKSNASECSQYRGGISLFWRPRSISKSVVVFLDRRSLAVKKHDTEFIWLAPSARPRFLNSGIEDARLFYFGGQLWFCGTTRDFNKRNTYEIILSDGKESFITNEPDNQKNWIPIVRGEKLFFIKSFSPHIVIEFRGREFVKVYSDVAAAAKLPGYRGNTPFIETARGLLGIIHVKRETKTRIRYLNYFALLNPHFPFLLHRVSRAFSLTNSDIEFFIGLVREDENTIIVSYGIDDCYARITKIGLEEVWSLFND
jgi:predicted GH43/DUF377 family glycosyl hydrolase